MESLISRTSCCFRHSSQISADFKKLFGQHDAAKADFKKAKELDPDVEKEYEKKSEVVSPNL